MLVRAESRRLRGRLKAGSFLTVVFAMGACDPELADWLEKHGQGGQGAVAGAPGGRGGQGAVAGAPGGRGGQGAVAGAPGGRGGQGALGGVAGSGGAAGGGGGLGGSGGAIVPPTGGVGGGEPTNPCAAALCPRGTICEVQRRCATSYPPMCSTEAVCVKPPSPPACGPVCDIFCEYGNVLDPKGCPTCRCNPPPQPVDPCATVRCGAGTHCEATPVTCVRAPCPPVATCVPDAAPVRCGGIAGVPCPGAGSCVDDPSDSCDVAGGGADCGGLCECNAIALCAPGTQFDSSPSVCACVPQPTPPQCGPVCLIFCEYGNVLDANGCPTCACKRAP